MATRINEEQLNELLYSGDIDSQRYLIEGGNRKMFKKWCKNHGVEPPKALLNDLPRNLMISHFEIDLINKPKKRFNHKRK